MDYLKDLAKQLSGTIRKQNQLDVMFSDLSLRRLTVRKYEGHKITIDEFGPLFSVGSPVNAFWELSINKPNIMFGFKYPARLPGFSFPVFTKEEYLHELELPANVPFWTAFEDLLRNMQFDSDEHVILYGQNIALALHAKKVTPELIERFMIFLNAHQGIFNDIRDLEDDSTIILPDALKPLAPYIQTYGISDDSLREELIDKMKRKEKITLVKAVQPLMAIINNYLDSFVDRPLDESAIKLGNLAELVSELMTDSSNDQ